MDRLRGSPQKEQLNSARVEVINILLDPDHESVSKIIPAIERFEDLLTPRNANEALISVGELVSYMQLGKQKAGLAGNTDVETKLDGELSRMDCELSKLPICKVDDTLGGTVSSGLIRLARYLTGQPIS